MASIAASVSAAASRGRRGGRVRHFGHDAENLDAQRVGNLGTDAAAVADQIPAGQNLKQVTKDRHNKTWTLVILAHCKSRPPDQ